MKPFTSECTNVQEGRQLIRAQSNAEEDAPLDLSFEGDVAGARTFSRRQALGLLGGSLAGATLLSLGLADPAKAPEPARPGPPVGSDIRHGTIITMECLGDKPGPRWLDGRTQDATVGLAPHTNRPFTGTQWTVFCVIPELYASHPDQTIMLRCEGNLPGPRWLDGRTDAGDIVLSPHTNPPFTGTQWRLDARGVTSNASGEDVRGTYILFCKGDKPGPRYLDGRTHNGTVGLAPHTNPPFTGTRWAIKVVQTPPAA